MPANIYECMFLLDTTKVAGDVQGAAGQLHGILEKNQAEILASRPWDERKLAFPIKNQKKGLYYLTYFKTDTKNLLNIERDVALNETILRSLVLKIEPQLVDTMLTLARDEHSFALQAASDDGTDMMGGGDRGDYRGGGDRGGDDRPRRGGRRSSDDDDKG